MIESQDGLDAAARDRARRSRRTTTRRRGRPTRRSCSTPTPTCNVWVMDVASGKAKIVGRDPWMVPQRTLNPGVESRLEVGRVRERACNSLYHAIFVTNVETGETKQVTDGLADAMWPVWDASGKYLWFLASTDFGLRSQWLDMTSYDHDENVRALPRGAEEGRAEPAAARERRRHGRRQRAGPAAAAAAAGVAARRRRSADATRRAGAGARQRRAPRTPVTVQIDFDGLQQRIISVPGVPAREYSQLKAGARRHGLLPRSAAPAERRGGAGGGSTLHRYRLSDRRAAPFVTGVADYDVSADGRKLLYRTGGGGGGRGGAAARPAPARRRPVPRRRRSQRRRRPGRGGSNATLRMYLEPKEEFKQIFNEGWRNQRDYLYVPNMHGADWPKMKEMYGAAAAVRESPRRSQLPARQHGRRDRHRPLLRARRRHAGRAAVARRPARRRLHDRERPLQDRAHLRQRELESGSARAARRRRASTSTVGDFIVAINGVELRAPDNIYRLLDGTANRQTRADGQQPARRWKARGR